MCVEATEKNRVFRTVWLRCVRFWQPDAEVTLRWGRRVWVLSWRHTCYCWAGAGPPGWQKYKHGLVKMWWLNQSIQPIGSTLFAFVTLCYVWWETFWPPSGSILILELNRKVQFYWFSLFYIFVLYKMCYNKSLDQYLYIIICIKHLHLQQKKSKLYGIKWY